MIHRFAGWLSLARPLDDLATVFDMTGCAITIDDSGLHSDQVGLEISSVWRDAAHQLTGSIDDQCHRPDTWLETLALALEADGVDFALELHDANDVVVRVFTPLG